MARGVSPREPDRLALRLKGRRQRLRVSSAGS